MSAYALITGVIFREPTQRTAKSGKPYTVCTVKAGSDDSGSGDFWSILSFSESSQLELLRLEIGDAVAIRGKLEIKTYVATTAPRRSAERFLVMLRLGYVLCRARKSQRSRRRRRHRKSNPPPPIRRMI